jgi:putative hydrolase of the HAD superfamily
MVLALTGLTPLFDAVYTIESLRFRPKPDPAGFRALLRAERLDPRRCVMVEDSLENLVTAKRLGMGTVWISTRRRGSPWVDVHLRRLRALPRHLPRL